MCCILYKYEDSWWRQFKLEIKNLLANRAFVLPIPSLNDLFYVLVCSCNPTSMFDERSDDPGMTSIYCIPLIIFVRNP